LKKDLEKEEIKENDKLLPPPTTAEKVLQKVENFQEVTPPTNPNPNAPGTRPNEKKTMFRKIFDFFSRSKSKQNQPPVIEKNDALALGINSGIIKESNEENTANENQGIKLDKSEQIMESGVEDENSKLENHDENSSDFNASAEIELSLCGHRIYSNDPDDIARAFEDGKVTYEEYSNDPLSILENPNLLIRFEDKLYEWKAAAPLILSLLAYKKPLPSDIMKQLMSGKKSKDKKQASKNNSKTSSPKPSIKPPPSPSLVPTSPQIDPQPILVSSKAAHSNPESPNVKAAKPLHVMVEEFNLNPEAETGAIKGKTAVVQNFLHQIEPTSEQLKELNLNENSNEIEFVVGIFMSSQIRKDGGFRGKQSVKGKIFLWDWKSKIVISDVDGTITKSDVFGQLMPILGKDWSHKGVVSLYHGIEKNGYKMIYVSSRAIGMADITRSYLETLQQSNLKLPKGPLLTSPDRLAMSFTREIISKKPQRFKILALRKIRDLFPKSWQPFIAGFGNRDTDMISYRAVGVDLHRIFIINEDGIVQMGTSTAYNQSYFLLIIKN